MKHLYFDPFTLTVTLEGRNRILVTDHERRKQYIFLKRDERREDTNVFKTFRSLRELEKKLIDLNIDQNKVDQIIKTI